MVLQTKKTQRLRARGVNLQSNAFASQRCNLGVFAFFGFVPRELLLVYPGSFCGILDEVYTRLVDSVCGFESEKLFVLKTP